jgi:hypothetical protein
MLAHAGILIHVKMDGLIQMLEVVDGNFRHVACLEAELCLTVGTMSSV